MSSNTVKSLPFTVAPVEGSIAIIAVSSVTEQFQSFRRKVEFQYCFKTCGEEMKIAHASITVKNMEESLNFYCNILGLKLSRRREIPENKAEIAFVQGEGQSNPSLELTYWREKKDWIDGDQLDHIALEVQNVVKSVEEFRKKDVEIAREPYSLHGSTRKIAFIKDPNGIWIELIQDN